MAIPPIHKVSATSYKDQWRVNLVGLAVSQAEFVLNWMSLASWVCMRQRKSNLFYHVKKSNLTSRLKQDVTTIEYKGQTAATIP